MNYIYINGYRCPDNYYSVDIETYIIVNVHRIAGSGDEVKVRLCLLADDVSGGIKIDMSRVDFTTVTLDDAEASVKMCKWPVIRLSTSNYVVAGLCSVSRQILKLSPHQKVRQLLGFRESCLVSCSETSVWTKFCEIDLVTSVKSLLTNELTALPSDVLRFEYHLSQPVRMHNVYKVARQRKTDKLEHTFAEGPFMTLADVIIYCLYKVINCFDIETSRHRIPLTLDWFERVRAMNVDKIDIDVEVSKLTLATSECDAVRKSLYSGDHVSNDGRNKLTNQGDIQKSLRLLRHIELTNHLYPYGGGDDIVATNDFDWSKVPMEANPIGGSLPDKRAYRKCDQLSNLAKAVIKVCAVAGCSTIVDFCSGSGHLGILLAVLLPHCRVILVENKEQSLARALERVQKLSLVNVTILQSNLDYFVSTFDVGVSLHACGVATDLVMEMCIRNKAHFVSCPCCYGGIHNNCHHLTYPRSLTYKSIVNMELRDYLTLAHAADQTHDESNRKTVQGFVCMDAIDTDRKLYAESCGYEVHLGKLLPVSCTNKNNLLVGIFKG